MKEGKGEKGRLCERVSKGEGVYVRGVSKSGRWSVQKDEGKMMLAEREGEETKEMNLRLSPLVSSFFKERGGLA